MATVTNNPSFGKVADELEIIELKGFDTAFAVSDSLQAATKRRFMTLFVSTRDTRMSGSSGTVSKAYNAKGEVFAIKRLIPGAVNSQTQLQQPFARSQISAFYEEYRAQRQLSNMKGFPKLYGYGMTDREPIIVMEWVEGLTLAHARKQLPSGSRPNSVHPTTVAQLGLGLFSILEGLDRMAERPVHRDISPSNVMLRTNEHSIAEQVASGTFDICLIDFGSATVVAPNNPNFTMTTNVWRNGTPEYAPPEMLTYDAPNVSQMRQSPSIDVYATSSILYELAVGYTPFQIGKHPEVSPYRRKMDNEPIPLPSELGVLGTAIMGGLKRDQQMRFPAKVLCDMCMAYLRGESAPWTSAAMAGIAGVPTQPSPTSTIPPVADYETTHLSMANTPNSTANASVSSQSSNPGTLTKGKSVLIALAAAVGAALVIGIPYFVLSL